MSEGGGKLRKESGGRDGSVGGTGNGVDMPLSTFEDLLEVVGTKGRWNLLMFFMCSIVAFISPLQALSYQFLGATPDHWCLVPQLVTANWTQHQVLSLAIPYSNDTSGYESCRMYDYDYEMVAELGYEAAMASRSSLTTNSDSPIECEARDFNRTQYQSTVVTEWDLVCDRRALYSTTQAVVMAGKLVGFVLFGYLIDMWGRRPVVLLTTVFNILASFLVAASPNVHIYIIFKFVITFMDAGQYLALFVFVMESCAARFRAGVGAMFVLPWALGYMAVPGIAYVIRQWQVLQAVYAIPTLYPLLFFWLLPESPRWLITQARFQEALKVLTWAARINKKTLPQDSVVLAAMASIHKQSAFKEAPEEAVDKDKPLWVRMWMWVVSTLKHISILLIIPQFRVRTLIIFFCWFSASMVYYGVALNATNLGTDPYLYVFLGGLLEVPSYLLLWPALVFIGRRNSLAVLYLLGSACIFSVLAIMVLHPEGSEGTMVGLSQAGKVAVTAAFQLVWAYTAELFPTKFRSLAVGEASVCARVGALLSPYINDLLGEMTGWAPSALFGTVSVLSAALSLLLPETRHADLSETMDIGVKARTGDAIAMESVRNGVDNPTFAPDNSSKQ